MSDKMIRNILEPAIHVLSLSIPFCFCIYFQYADVFNPTPIDNWCSFATYPFDCYVDQEIECIRGSVGAMNIAYGSTLGIMFVSLLCVTICMVMIIVVACCGDQVNFETSTTRHIGERSERSILFTKKSLKILLIKQAIFYILGFYLTWIFPIISATISDHISVFVLTLFFWPLQGLVNASIFIYNKVLNLKRNNESITTCEALNLIIIHPDKMPEIYLAEIRRVAYDHQREENRRNELLARTENRDDDFASDRGNLPLSIGKDTKTENRHDGNLSDLDDFLLTIGEEMSFIFDDRSALMNRKRPSDHVNDDAAVSLQDDQNQFAMSSLRFDKVSESNDAEDIRGNFDANLSLEENQPLRLSEDSDLNDFSYPSKSESESRSNSNLSLDS